MAPRLRRRKKKLLSSPLWSASGLQQSIPGLWPKHSGKPHNFDQPGGGGSFNQAQNSPAHFKPINTDRQNAVNTEIGGLERLKANPHHSQHRPTAQH